MDTLKSDPVSSGDVTPNGEPILLSKLLVPAVASPVVCRARLHELLTAGVQGPLTLVSAPAGSGKTVLVSSWVVSGAPPGVVVWISLDEEDDAPGIFWSYVLAGLRRARVDVGGVSPPSRAKTVDHSLLVRLAAAFSTRAEPVVLVLDNAEALNCHEIPDELDFVLRHAAGGARFVIVTRVDPNWPLPRYRLDGTVTEIRFAELAFTPAEAKELLSIRRPEVPDSAVRAFSYTTRGWAAGLKLAGLTGTLAPAADGAADAGDSDIATYFRSEVLDVQPPPVREFLLTTSVVDVLRAELAVHLSRRSEAGATLRALAEASVFVDPVPGVPDAYAYHPLVRDLLRAQLHQETPGRKRRLHRRAARWLAGAGEVMEAVGQLAAAGDWEDACVLLINGHAVGRMLAGGTGTGLGRMFSRMPGCTPGPAAALVSAALAVLEWDLDACDKHLGRVDELVSTGPGGEVPGLPAAAALISMARAAGGCRPDEALAAVACAQEMMTDLEPGPDRATTSLILFCLGRVRVITGELAAAQAMLAAAAREADTEETRPLQAAALATLALLLAVHGDLDAAVETAGEATRAAQSRSAAPEGVGAPAPVPVPVSVSVPVDVTLAWVCCERLDLARARAHLETAVAAPELFRDPLVASVGTLVRSRLLRADSDPAAALRTLGRWRDRRCAQAPIWLARRMDAEEAMLLVSQGRADLADVRVRRHATEDHPACLLAHAWVKLSAGAVAESGRAARQVIKQVNLPFDLLVEAHLLAAASAVAMSRPEVAAVEVEDAVRVASEHGLRRPLEQGPPRLQTLVRNHEQRRQLERTEPEVAELPSVVAVGAGHGPAPGVPRPVPPGADALLVQPLTEREREVLGYLDALLPTEEIAARMFVSVNTVKTHVRAILRKLAAERRYEAVRRARDLGLL